jgi:hypothetical protein
MKNKLILALICLLASCQSYRAERKINKLKQWGYLSDSTIIHYDTIRGWQIDTFIQFDTINKIDTIITSNNGFKVVTFVKWKERQVKQILTQNDTIFTHKYTTKVIKEPRKWWDRFKIGLMFGSILVVFMFYSAYKINDKSNN